MGFFRLLSACLGIAVALATGMTAQAQPTIKVAYTDPLSGPFAQVGDANLKLDTVKGYVPRGKVLRINPASQVMMCPVEFFNMTRTEIRA